MVSVVVVHRGQPAPCRETVAALLAQREVIVRCLVVDSGSDPAALAALRVGLVADGPGSAKVDVVALGANVGFGPAANAGLRRLLDDPKAVTGEWLGVAPHDAGPAPGCLHAMLAVLADLPRAGLAGADVGDGATPIVDRYLGGFVEPARVAEGWEPAAFPHGTLMVARRSCLEEVGLFDERYFAYGEEADLGLRARAAGWEVGIVRGARVTNLHLGTATATVDELQQRNTLLLVRDHFGRYPAAVRLVLGLASLALGVLRPARRSSPVFSVRGRVSGLVDHLRGRYGPPRAAR